MANKFSVGRVFLVGGMVYRSHVLLKLYSRLQQIAHTVILQQVAKVPTQVLWMR